ncbi:hypothetical protein Q5424_15500 [Conexibacter sp. JD483]|uniref:hypothetical protein n=1 Tax=unclassified Conexibacter TaxID=2627773 RepID=UPI00271B2EEC|nr:MULTISPECIES: hypothetical protein [unclassified Conexibacter]MDO8185700.1 hypothetical protein [Conexibacter sp. CPCC 205706]MDO8199077.1 hypothetical protein [Conexibacter sp. CPCC 205762]MDR9370504.1 hypothetical protein [Conexibacter sp. JD483]
MWRRRGWAGAALALLVAAAAGCGGGDDGPSTSRAQSTSTANSAPSGGTSDAKQRAISSLLVERDLRGSRAQGSVIAYGSRELRELEARAAEMGSGGALLGGCSDIARSGPRAVAFAMTQLVIEHAATAVTSMTMIFGDETQARAVAALYGTATTRDCLAREFRGNMRAILRRSGFKGRVGDATARAVALPEVGDTRYGMLIALPGSGGGTRMTVYAEHFVVQDGAAIGLVTTTTDGTPPASDGREFLAARVAERLSRITAPATTTETPTTTTPQTTAATKPVDEAQKERALSALLQPGDLPGFETEGEAEALWTAGSNRGRDAGNPFASRCIGGRATWRLLVQARAQRFVFPAGNIQNGLFVFEDAQQASDALRIYDRPQMRDCFARRALDQLRTGMRLEGESGYTIGKPAIRTRDLGQIGDDSYAMQLTIPLKAGSDSATFFTDIVLVRQEEAISMISTLVFGEAAPGEVLKPLTELAADRLEEVYG